MYARTPRITVRANQRRGNVWSGVVALVLLAMCALALVTSELDNAEAHSRAPVVSVIAGQ